ncbi:glycoside hydrolase family 16 protein [Lyophyllum atratum]|nr:glycoside hydrolase family 16 protein [Lyophyllum atratum]
MYTGAGFLNGWDFFTGGDPTHGSVKFQSKADAMAKGLAFVQSDGTTVLAVDDKTSLPLGAKRDSVRISSKKKYNGGLFIADFFAMPHGCSVWPAYWSVGPKWPQAGEIDILEGVHDQPTNQYTLHTSAGCTLSAGNSKVASKVLNKAMTYGKGFNVAGGGVYAHLWNKDGIKIWHFARNEIPADIQSKKPNPSFLGRSCRILVRFILRYGLSLP